MGCWGQPVSRRFSQISSEKCEESGDKLTHSKPEMQKNIKEKGLWFQLGSRSHRGEGCGPKGSLTTWAAPPLYREAHPSSCGKRTLDLPPPVFARGAGELTHPVPSEEARPETAAVK